MKWSLCILALATLLISSCSAPKSYYRSTPYIPTSTGVGDVEIAGALSMNHVEGFVAGQVTDKIGLMAQSFIGGLGYVTDFSVGYHLNDAETLFSTYLGYGRGQLNGSYNNFCLIGGGDECDDYALDISYTKLFVQPNFSIVATPTMTFSFSTRINYLKFDRFSYVQLHGVDGIVAEEEFTLLERDGIIIEPNVQFKFCKRRFFGYFQFGLSSDDFKGSHPFYTQEFLNGGIGFKVGKLER